MSCVCLRVPLVTKYQKPVYKTPPIARNATSRRYQGSVGSLPSVMSVILLLASFFRDLVGGGRRRLCVLLLRGAVVGFHCERDNFGLQGVGIRLRGRRSGCCSRYFRNFALSLDIEVAEQSV